ncbi:MAG TPA: UMP kinase [Spirochaetales bacterium]|nr:UMP kinase [Spirochaetales bacterium]HRY54769.1 UMP kinase [Spirochaetia bacterium]HRZ64303.1 UMP kinase [Spirochaetia bacterium]
MTTVLSLGGSIVAPEGPDAAFVASFAALAREHLAADAERRLILVVGGGGPARAWQKAYREALAAAPGSESPNSPAEAPDADAQDWVGIMATRLNAQLVKAVLGGLCPMEVVTDPSAVTVFRGRVLVAAGWKPGFSTDFDAVLLAERFGAGRVLNLSNVAKVYTADPRVDPKATPIDSISWEQFRLLVGDEWVPGKNVPFDPVASRRAAELGLEVVCAAGRDLPNLRAILGGGSFVGTVIGPK